MLSKGLAREENKGLISSDCLGLDETFQWIIRGRDFLVLPIWHFSLFWGVMAPQLSFRKPSLFQYQSVSLRRSSSILAPRSGPTSLARPVGVL